MYNIETVDVGSELIFVLSVKLVVCILIVPHQFKVLIQS